MDIYTKKEMAIVGPNLVSAKDPKGKVWWRMVFADGRSSGPVEDRAHWHKWIRDKGYTRFDENGEVKLFPEDPESGDPVEGGCPPQ